MKNIVLTGSIAFDSIMNFDGLFKDSLIEGDLDRLSVSFLAPNREFFYGGCAGNIAYAVKLLGESPLLVGVAGNDFKDYKKFLEKHRISTKCIEICKDSPTAAAYILTDNDQNQISIFSPGAMSNMDLCMDLCSCKDAKNAFCAMVSPGIPDRMISLAQSCIDSNIPFLFDPGQAIAALNSDSLALLIDCCWGLVTNEYEASLLEEKLSLPIRSIASKAGFLIVTTGKNGCSVYQNGLCTNIPSVPDLDVLDVTGAGDAFRAGLLHGLKSGVDLNRSCEIANTAASFAVSVRGTQTYKFTISEFEERLNEFYPA